jgi:hypothetical protein
MRRVLRVTGCWPFTLESLPDQGRLTVTAGRHPVAFVRCARERLAGELTSTGDFPAVPINFEFEYCSIWRNVCCRPSFTKRILWLP